MTKIDDDNPEFPEGTIIVKTFYYYLDNRNPDLGTNIIETRLLIKKEGQWNVATYVWNDAQTDAVLENNGANKYVEWVDANGNIKSVTYEVPTKQECTICHQIANEIEPIGPKLRNMNVEVIRDNEIVNQLTYFQSMGLLENFDHNLIGKIPDYFDTTMPLEDRGRAYLEMNCAHCHNPSGLPKAASIGFDFRYATPFSQTGILEYNTKIDRVIKDVYMPWIGTTILDEEGYTVVSEYLNSL